MLTRFRRRNERSARNHSPADNTVKPILRNLPVYFALVVTISVLFLILSPTCYAEEGTSWKNVFHAVFRGVNPLLDQVEQTLTATPDALAFFRYERMDQSSIFTADGPDFSRMIGLVIRTDGQSLVPFWFFPVTQKVQRLNNIVLLPQVYLPVKDEYGPTKRYQIRQDIPILGGFHIFFWPLAPLLAEERNGWIWVTTMPGFDLLPKEPLDLLPEFSWQPGALFQARLDPSALSRPLADGLLRVARIAACEIDRSPFHESKVGPEGAKAFDQCSRYISRLWYETESLDLLLRNDKGQFTTTLNWKILPQSEFAKLFAAQASDHKANRIGVLFKNADAWLPDCTLKLQLTKSEIELIQNACVLFDFAHAEKRVNPRPVRNFLQEEISQKRLSATGSFSKNSSTFGLTVKNTFFPYWSSEIVKTINEQKKKEEQKKKPVKKEEFDITF